MKFEAEIIKAIVDSRGHEKSSIHYQSECVEEWVKEVEGAYPKLCDYQPEWLNYSAENKVGVFPYVALTDVTSATVENVVPYAYKSAILSGNTLVNLDGGTLYLKTDVNANLTEIINIPFKQNLIIGKKYLVIFNVSDNNLISTANVLDLRNSGTEVQTSVINIGSSKGIIKSIITAQIEANRFRFRCQGYSGGNTISLNNFLILEYQEGMENWDIPYFTGMQSVKLPVLTTTNEDGTKTNILSTPSDLELRGIGEVKDTLNCNTGEVTERIKEVVLNGSENWVARSGGTSYAYFINNFFGYNNVEGITSSFKFIKGGAMSTQTQESICSATTQTSLSLFTNKDELSTVENLKSYLSQNPVTIQYPIATESVKTVDLTVVDQDGNEREQIKPIEGTMHLSTSGETINPLFSGEIPVEAITQNLASFIEE